MFVLVLAMGARRRNSLPRPAGELSLQVKLFGGRYAAISAPLRYVIEWLMVPVDELSVEAWTGKLCGVGSHRTHRPDSYDISRRQLRISLQRCTSSIRNWASHNLLSGYQ